MPAFSVFREYFNDLAGALALKHLIAASVVAALFAASAIGTSAQAASAGEQVSLCAADVVAKGYANADARARLLKTRGGGVKTVTILIDGDDGEAVTATCKIKRGEVIEMEIAE